jgi:microfibrillar-associated protein 1
MNQLLGGGLSERLLSGGGGRRQGASSMPGNAASNRRGGGAKKEKDVADMTAAETATFLLEKQARKGVAAGDAGRRGAGAERHRATKVRQYHQLLAEQLQQEQPVQQYERRRQEEEEDEDDSSSSDSSSTLSKSDGNSKVAASRSAGQGPADLSPSKSTPERLRRPRYYDSDDESESRSRSSSPEPGRRRRRGRSSSSSSSSSSDENDDRRQRLLRQRQASAPAPPAAVGAALEPRARDSGGGGVRDGDGDASLVRGERQAPSSQLPEPARGPERGAPSGTLLPQRPPELVPSRDRTKEPQVARTSSESSQSSSSSSSSGSSTSDSEEDDDSDDDGGSRPATAASSSAPGPIVFVPKHRRHLQPGAKEAERALEAEEDRKRLEYERRRQESRAMVHQVVLEAKSASGSDANHRRDGGALEGITGARNPVPSDDDGDEQLDIEDDDDDNNPGGSDRKRDRERQDWEVRELVRLLHDADVERERAREALEVQRRRNMTDEELMREQESEAGRSETRVGGRRRKQQEEEERPGGQRYYHKGAFFLDDSEWAESDVRHRASEYAQAPTGSDRVDKRKLPSVMQTKKFGMANQSKYQGLAKEDTSDRTAESLPLVFQPRNRTHKK